MAHDHAYHKPARKSHKVAMPDVQPAPISAYPSFRIARRAWRMLRYGLAAYWGGMVFVEYPIKVTDGGDVLPENAIKTAVADVPESEVYKATYALKDHFSGVVHGYKERDELTRLAPAEQAYIDSYNKHVTKLFEMRTRTGFYGVLLQDKKTGETFLSFTGVDFKFSTIAGLWEFWKDLDDTIILASGRETSQTNDAIAFAREAQKVSRRVAGRDISYCVGHSLGEHNMAFVQGINLLSGAKFYHYDGPGIKTSTVRKCARMSGLSIPEVEKIFRENSYSFTLTHNMLNIMGQQPGIAITDDNNPCQNQYFPDRHVMNERFVQQVQAVNKPQLYAGSEDSGAPWRVIALSTLVIAALTGPEIHGALQTRRRKKMQAENETAEPKHLPKEYRPAYAGHRSRYDTRHDMGRNGGMRGGAQR